MDGVQNNNGRQAENGKGESYSFSDRELIRALVKSRLDQKSALEYEDLDGYELPPRTQFSMLNKPSVSIKYGKMTFNMACIRLFEGVQFILPLVHREKNKLTIVTCSEEESASVAWARQKDGEWKNKTITSEDFIEKIYRMMGWNRSCRYKVMGKVANSSQGLVLVFELNEAIMFAAKPVEFTDKETGEVKKKQVKYYPDEYKDRIGKSYTDYVSARQINMFEYLEEYVGQTYSDMPEASSEDNMPGIIKSSIPETTESQTQGAAEKNMPANAASGVTDAVSEANGSAKRETNALQADLAEESSAPELDGSQVTQLMLPFARGDDSYGKR